MSHYKFEDARVRRVHARRGKKDRERGGGTREQEKNGERERDGARGRCITVTLPR